MLLPDASSHLGPLTHIIGTHFFAPVPRTDQALVETARRGMVDLFDAGVRRAWFGIFQPPSARAGSPASSTVDLPTSRSVLGSSARGVGWGGVDEALHILHNGLEQQRANVLEDHTLVKTVEAIIGRL
jgi:hypothetical protein